MLAKDPERSTPAPPRPFVVVAWAIFAVALLKGLRMPNLWSATHLTFNYGHGFIRRGLIGEILRTIGRGGRLYNYSFFAVGSIVLLIAVAAVLGHVIRKAVRTDGGDTGLQGAVLVFAASPGLVFFVHEIGYLDYLGFLLLLLFVLFAARAPRRWPILAVAGALGVVLALIHESLVVMFAPVMLFAMLCRIAADARGAAGAGVAPRTPWLQFAGAGAVTATSFAASTVVGMVGTKSPATIHALEASIARHANFPLRGDAFEALYRPVRENILSLMPQHWRDPDSQRYLVTGLVVAFPAVAFLAGFGVRQLGRLGLPAGTRRILSAVLVGAALAPLLLNFVGWDSARWNAICVLSAFTCVLSLRLLLVAREAEPSRFRVDGTLPLALAGVAIVIGLVSTNYRGFLFDGYAVQWFPFEGQIDSAIELVRGGMKSLPRM